MYIHVPSAIIMSHYDTTVRCLEAYTLSILCTDYQPIKVYFRHEKSYKMRRKDWIDNQFGLCYHGATISFGSCSPRIGCRRQCSSKDLNLNSKTKTFADAPEKIVGGTDAYLGEFPYQVSLRSGNSHFCGGSLIGNQFVLTAAHCIVGVVTPPFNGITVVTGTISSVAGGEHHKIKDVVVHPNYVHDMSESHKNDIAIITLAAPITPNSYQKPIRVAAYEPAEGASLTATGWGLLSVNGVIAPTLQKMTVYALGNRSCQSYMGGQPIFDTHMCTISARGIGACSGDSGGPLVYNGEIVGITSFVFPCALGYPDVYTKAPRYLSFINSVIKA